MKATVILPAHCYRDPAIVAEQNELAEMGCKACRKHRVVLDRVFCTEPKIKNQKLVPAIGSKCRYFDLKD